MVTLFWFTLFPFIFGGNCDAYEGAETGNVKHNFPFILKYHNNDKLNIFLTLTNMNQNMSVGVYFSYHASGGKLNEREIEDQETSTVDAVFVIDPYLLHKPYVKVYLSLHTESGYVNKTIANGTLVDDNGQDTDCLNSNMCHITVDAAEIAKGKNKSLMLL
nr:uncharacterized protein LOC126056822 [Helicoverpa armigera]